VLRLANHIKDFVGFSLVLEQILSKGSKQTLHHMPFVQPSSIFTSQVFAKTQHFRRDKNFQDLQCFSFASVFLMPHLPTPSEVATWPLSQRVFLHVN
jgi:hypothetical protein